MSDSTAPAASEVANLPDVDALASDALDSLPLTGVTHERVRRWMQDVLEKTCAAVHAHYAWRPIETAPRDGEDLDLFGYIEYDLHEFRLTGCEFKDGEWHYFQAGELLPVSNLGFTATHWMPSAGRERIPVVQDPT